MQHGRLHNGTYSLLKLEVERLILTIDTLFNFNHKKSYYDSHIFYYKAIQTAEKRTNIVNCLVDCLCLADIVRYSGQEYRNRIRNRIRDEQRP